MAESSTTSGRTVAPIRHAVVGQRHGVGVHITFAGARFERRPPFRLLLRRCS
ncbi:MAG: hypothetical protein NZ553_04840 [Caldilinea sp.]|nr:hypothetical protein [Caldilinea sp.]MDW8439782.1 hypothetical protein [Caldilineaceae bacterium]